jgi:hypothetical protein
MCACHACECAVLRRFYVTKTGRVIMASEVGVVDIAPGEVERKGRLMPGNILLVDFDAHSVIADEEVRGERGSAGLGGCWVCGCWVWGVVGADVRAVCGCWVLDSSGKACLLRLWSHSVLVLAKPRHPLAPLTGAPLTAPTTTVLQMKKRYSSAKPYGEWLAQEVVTLAQIEGSVPEAGGCWWRCWWVHFGCWWVSGAGCPPSHLIGQPFGVHRAASVE